MVPLSRELEGGIATFPTPPIVSPKFQRLCIFSRHGALQILLLLGRPEQPFRTGLCFTRDVIFFSPLVLRGPSTDRPETLPYGRNLV